MGRFLTAAITFALIAFYTRILSPDEYGIYTFVLAIVALLQGAGLGWLSMGALRLSEREGKREQTLAAILVCFVVATALSLIGLFVLWAIEGSERTRWLLIIGAAFFLTQGWYEINLSLLRARLLVSHYVVFTIIRTVVASAVGAVLAWIGWGAEGILIGGVLGVFVPACVLTVRLWVNAQIQKPRKEDLQDMVRFGVPLGMGFTVGAVILVTDRFLIELYLGVYLLGIYGAAYHVADRIIRSIAEPIGSASLPLAITKFETEGVEATRRQLVQNWGLLIIVLLPSTVGLSVVMPSLVQIMVGPEYREGANAVAPIIAFATFLNGIRAGYLDTAYHLGQKTQLLLIQSTSVAVVNIAISIPLVLEFGIIGAAYGTLISQFVGVVMSSMLGRLSFDIPLELADTTKVFGAAAVMWVSLAFLPLEVGLVTLIAQVLIGGAVYAGILWLLNPFDLRPQVLEYLGPNAVRHSPGN